MSAIDFLVKKVIDEVRPMLTPDGGNVELVSISDGVVTVNYDKGHNEHCVDCVMPPEDFRLYLLDMLHDRAPGVLDVKVIASSKASRKGRT